MGIIIVSTLWVITEVEELIHIKLLARSLAHCNCSVCISWFLFFKTVTTPVSTGQSCIYSCVVENLQPPLTHRVQIQILHLLPNPPLLHIWLFLPCPLSIPQTPNQHSQWGLKSWDFFLPSRVLRPHHLQPWARVALPQDQASLAFPSCSELSSVCPTPQPEVCSRSI